MRIASFDLGMCNFAFCVEELDDDWLDGHLTRANVCASGSLLLLERHDLTRGRVVKRLSVIDLLMEATRVLDCHQALWDTCTVVLIERQMKTNASALHLAHHCMSYFLFRYGRFKQIVSFPAKHKTRQFCSTAMTQGQRKRWTVQRSMELLRERGDGRSIGILERSSKKDDLADTIMQLQAYKTMVVIHARVTKPLQVRR